MFIKPFDVASGQESCPLVSYLILLRDFPFRDKKAHCLTLTHIAQGNLYFKIIKC